MRLPRGDTQAGTVVHRLASWLAGRRPGRGPRGPADRGSLTLMLAVLFVALIALAGIVIDGGAKLTAAENASAVAQEAARAGAGIVNRASAYQSGNFIVARDQAIAAADEYLARPATTASPGRCRAPRTRSRSL